MSRAARVIDVAVGAAVAVWSAALLHPDRLSSWVAVVLASAVGLFWRRPLLALGCAGLAAGVAPGWPGELGQSTWFVPVSFVVAVSLGAFARARLAAPGVAAVVLTLLWGGEVDVPTLLWVALLFGGLASIASVVARSWRRADTQRRRVQELISSTPEDVARRAVIEERRRLAVEVQRVIRDAIVSMRERAAIAATADNVATADLRAIHRDGQQAIGELRCLLGLLRDAPDPPRAAAHPASLVPRRSRLPFGLVFPVGVVVLALVEQFLYDGPGGAPLTFADVPPSAVLLTALGAATVALRSSAPGLAAACLGAVFLVAQILDVMIVLGIWTLLVLVLLSWAAASDRSVTGLLGLLALLVGIVTFQVRWAPEDVELVIIMIVTAATAASITARRAAAAAAAGQAAARLSKQHADASAQAVHAERLIVARELHDVVSHAVVVMVVQAGAAEVLLPINRAAAEQALEVIGSTAAAALAELDQLLAVVEANGSGPTGRNRPVDHDLSALIERMRAGGLDVELRASGLTGAGANPVAYRIVQETLTNALRHAPGSHVRVLVEAQPAETKVEVTDDGPGPGRATGRGYGLVGLTERVEQAGGFVETGPGPDGTGFQVSARIPIPAGSRP